VTRIDSEGVKLIMCMFGSVVYRIDFDRIDLCLDAIMQNGLNIMIVVWIVLIKIAFEYIITKMDIVKYK